MAFSEEDKVFTKVLHPDRVMERIFYQLFRNKNWSLSSVKKLLKKIG